MIVWTTLVYDTVTFWVWNSDGWLQPANPLAALKLLTEYRNPSTFTNTRVVSCAHTPTKERNFRLNLQCCRLWQYGVIDYAGALPLTFAGGTSGLVLTAETKLRRRVEFRKQIIWATRKLTFMRVAHLIFNSGWLHL